MLRSPGKRRRGRPKPTPHSAQPSQPNRAEAQRDPTNAALDDAVRRALERNGLDRTDPVVVARVRNELEVEALVRQAFPEVYDRPSAVDLLARHRAHPELLEADAILGRLHRALIWDANPPHVDKALVEALEALEVARNAAGPYLRPYGK